MSFSDYTIQQPFYIYQEYLKYNVVPGVITLNFTTLPSQDFKDYLAIATGGQLDSLFQFGFSTVDSTCTFIDNTVELKMPVVMEFNCYIQIYYQGAALPFRIRCKQNLRYTTPAIFEGLAYNF